MTERELEKLVKNKLDNRDIPFNPENWKRMEAILDQKAAPGGYLWSSAAAIVLFGVIVASLIYFNPGLNNPPSEGLAVPVREQFSPSEQEELAPAKEPSLGQGNALDDVKPENTATNSNMASSAESAQKASQEVGEDLSREATNSVNRTSESGKIMSSSTSVDDHSGVSNKEQTSTTAIGYNDAYASDEEFSENERKVEVAPIAILTLTQKSYELPKVEETDLVLIGRPQATEANHDLPRKMRQPSGLFATAGPAFTGSNTDNTLGVGWAVGLGYNYQLPHGFSVETGVGFSRYNNVNISNQADSTFYSFGYETVEVKENNRRLEYVEIPLRISYKFADRHQLGVGGYLGMLVNVERDVERTTYRAKGPTQVEQTRTSGYLDEFNRWDYGLNFFYRYSISRRFRVGLHLNQGLVDITHDGTAKGYQQDHKNTNTRVVLEYNLF